MLGGRAESTAGLRSRAYPRGLEGDRVPGPACVDGNGGHRLHEDVDAPSTPVAPAAADCAPVCCPWLTGSARRSVVLHRFNGVRTASVLPRVVSLVFLSTSLSVAPYVYIASRLFG